MLLNPALLYASIWSFVLFLYALRLSEVLEPLRLSTVVLLVGTSVSFIAGWCIESLPYYGNLSIARLNLEKLADSVNSNLVGKRVRRVWIIFALGISFEFAYFGGAPGLGLVGVGRNIPYTEFGIHGFHGLMNAMFFAACALQFTKILFGSSKRSIVLGIVSIGYPFLTMSREVLISALLQYLFIYFSIKRPSALLFVRAALIFIVTFLVFGYLGDLRSGRENIIALGAPSFDYPEWLPSAFIWFYIYLCTPLNNVNFNIDITPTYLPLETAGTLIPSFAREAFISLGGERKWDLVTDNFNVSSLLQSFLMDFGVAGAVIFTLLCGVCFSRVLRHSRHSPSAFFAVIVLLHGIALSFFANLLFNLISVFEIIILSWLVSRRRKSS